MRIRTEIEDEYKSVAMLYGDRLFKCDKLQEEADTLREKMNVLIKEVASDDPVPPPPPVVEAFAPAALAEAS